MLIDRGFTLVRPLAGGLDAWVEAGSTVDADPLIAIRPGPPSVSSESAET
jgi:hypothetical protein